MIKLIQGDCLEHMKTMEDNFIDLTVTSPPYDNLRKYKNSLEWGESIWKPIIIELYRIAKEGGIVVWIIGDATINRSETGTSFKQALWAKECGFYLYDTMFWEKLSRLPTHERYYNVVEYMFIFSKGKPKTLNFIKDHKNKSEGHKMKKHVVINKGKAQKHKDKYFVTPAYSRRSNIWKYRTAGNGTNHPAIFPEQLAHDHIISWSNENDLVLDPFAGSGTTGLAANKLNRDVILIEKVPEYCEIIKKRLNI